MSQERQSTADEPSDIELQLALGDRGEPPYEPVDDQRAVLASYFEGTGRVVVDASAGTGKTTTLVVTLAETVVRTASESANPLSDMLVTTFGRDATAELKTRLKRLLRHHVDNGGDLPQEVFRWIETESNIRTLDALFADLLREVAIELTVPPDFTVDDRLELQQLREEIFADLRREYRSEFRTLEAAYPAEEWRAYPPDTVEAMLASAQQNCREFGISTTEAAQSLRESLVVGHGGEGGHWLDKNEQATAPDSIPPETVDDITAILRAVVGENAELSVDSETDAQQLVDHLRDTYFETEAAIDAFETLLGAYEQAYDSRTRRAGQFTFTDVAHLLSSYLDDCEPTDPFRQTLGRRFDHVFVDEFQDTSAVQCAVLRQLVDPDGEIDDPDDESANLLLIGDSKQAIYEWRSADPALFADIIETTRATAPEPATIPHLDVSDVRYHALTTVFRHHPDIAAAANHVFQRLLEDEGRGAIGGSGPSYVPVDPYGSPWEADRDKREAESDSHIHVLNVGAKSDELSEYIRAADWAAAESTRVAETIAAITDPETEEPPVTIPAAGADEGTDDGGTRQPTPGDITLLFRSTRQIQQYATTLRNEYDIAAEAVATGDLFEQPEIELLIDLLSWIARPYDTDLRRLLRSPLVALSDETIRTVVAADSELETLLGAWPESLPADDRQRLAGLVSLRADLSWERETSKTALIHRLLQHSGLDGILLSDSDGVRRYGNIWLLTELVDDWEVDELLSYREFRSRLQQLRDGTDSSDPQFSVADVTDGERGDAVTLTTVHGAKGQEYPIVFLCDLPKPSNYPRLQHDRLVMSRQHGVALRPRPGSPPSPTGVDFPTPDSDLDQPVWFNDDLDSTSYPDATGPVWLSDARTDTGEIRYPNPLNAHIEAHEAEFWRLAYVAFTRAEHHVFLGLGDLDPESDYADQARWTTWLEAFNELLAPDAGWDAVTDREPGNRTLERTLSWNVDPDNEIAESVPIAVDEIPPQSPDSTADLDLIAELGRLPGTGDEIDTQPYRPRTVSASSVPTLASCPRAFQYRHVQAVEPARQPSRPGQPDLPAGSTSNSTTSGRTPGDLAPNEWGDIVHRAIELRVDDRERAEQYIEAQPAAVEPSLRTVVSAVESAPVIERCQSTPGEWVTEYELSSLVSTGGRELRVTGTVDLLYRADGGWQLVDWKTGQQPANPGDSTHSQQLAVYAWLLEQQFGITVDTATLGYIDPDGEAVLTPVGVTETLDTEWVGRIVESATDTLPVDSEAGLETRPDPNTCGNCPYGRSVGGPCPDDFYENVDSE